MSFIKQLFAPSLKFTPATPGVNWQRIETLVHGPGAGDRGETYNSALFACLDAVSMAYPEPPLKVYRQNSAGKSELLPDSPLQDLLDNPTPFGELTIEEIRYWTAWAKHVDGNAYWLKVRAGDAETGNVVQLWPISPTLIRPVTEKGSGDWISYYEYTREPGKAPEPVSVGNIIHFRLGLDDKDMRKGLSRLKALVRQLSTDDEADRFVDALLKNYAVPGLVITPVNNGTMDQDDADMITEKTRRKFGSDNRGNVAVMAKEMKVEQFGFSPKDLDMSILHRIPEERISAVIGVPAIVAGLGAGLDRATYANFKEAREMFTESKLVPQWRADAAKINTSLTPDFTSDKWVSVAHDLTDVRALQEDEDKKYTRLRSAVGKPWMTRNEARTDTGQEPIDGWDEEDVAPRPEPQQPPQRQVGNRNQPRDERALDLERWQRKAIKRVEDGQPAACTFTSQHIPAGIAGAISGGLEAATTVEAVKAIFEDALAWEAYP